MTSEIINRNELAGFVCPSCRMVFSAHSDLHGSGVICPGCDNALSLPKKGEQVAEIEVIESSALNHSAVATQTSDAGEGQTGGKRRSSKPDYEDGFGEDEPTEFSHNDYSLKLIIPLLALSLIVLGGIGYLFLGSGPNDVTPSPTISQNQDVNVAATEDGTDDGSNGHAVVEQEPKSVAMSEQEQKSLTEQLLIEWFSSKSIDEKVKLVRPVAEIREKMERYYTLYPQAYSEFKSLDRFRNLAGPYEFSTFVCTTKDYNSHAGIIQIINGKGLLDWESHVAYSEMTWAEIADKKPTTPVKVRVITSRGNYYNNEFDDELKWQAVTLQNPNEEDVIYGYVLKNSALDQKIFNFGNSNEQASILEIQCPPNDKHGNQVLITEMITDGWLEKPNKEK